MGERATKVAEWVTKRVEPVRVRAKKIKAPFVGVWSARPFIDWLLVAGVLLALAAVQWRSDWLDSLSIAELGKDDRMRLYTTVATVSSLLFGFATASIAFFYGSAKGERVELLKKFMNDQIVRTWRASLSAPLVAVAVAVAAMSFDTRTDGRPQVSWAVEGALVFLGLRAVRLRWMFVGTLGLVSEDIANPQGQTVASKSGKARTPKKSPAAKGTPDVPVA